MAEENGIIEKIKKGKALVAEDNVITCDMLPVLIDAALGIQTVACKTPEELAEALKYPGKYSVIFLDHQCDIAPDGLWDFEAVAKFLMQSENEECILFFIGSEDHHAENWMKLAKERFSNIVPQLHRFAKPLKFQDIKPMLLHAFEKMKKARAQQ